MNPAWPGRRHPGLVREADASEALRRRRCLIPADGFYEWVAAAGGPRRPYHFRRKDGRPFAFAGLWMPVRSEEACTILTTAPNELVRPLHDRMPVMLSPEDYGLWLDPEVTQPSRIQPLSAATIG